MSIVVLILNFLLPFSLGTDAFMCCFPNKDKTDIVHAICHIGFTILTYVMFFVLAGTFEYTASIIYFFSFLGITYAWGLLFGVFLICKVRSVPVHQRMAIPITTNKNYVDMHQYQPLHQ